MAKLNEFLFGTKDKIKKAGTLTPEQEQLMKLITEGLTKGTGSFGDIFGKFNPEEFQKGVAEPAMKNFQENILPQIQEKFIAGNQVLGSGFRNAQLKAGKDLQSDLANLMYQAQGQQKQNKLAGIQTQMGTRGFENLYKQGKTGAVQSFLNATGEGIGKAGTMAIMG
jgi:hypothetical protein